MSALRHRNYRLYWFGQLFSVLAQNMEAVAQSWLVLEITNSPLLLGLTGLTFSIPTIALTLLGGAVADRADRKRIMIFSQIGSVVMFLLLALLVITERVALWHVMTLPSSQGASRLSTGRAGWLYCRRWCRSTIFRMPSQSAAPSGS